MKNLGLLLVVIVAGPAWAWSQCCTALNFPLRMGPGERDNVGFAVVNTSTDDGEFSFDMYNSIGAKLTSATRMVPAGGQLALLMSELFPGVGSTDVWVQANALGTSYSSFWLGGDFTTHTDGATVPDEIRNHLLPVTDGHTQINIVNPGVSGLLLTVEPFDTNGQSLAAPRTLGMEEKQASQFSLQSLFAEDMSSATHVRVASQRQISIAALVRDYLVSPSVAVINSSDSDVFVQVLHFPHVVSGPLGSSNYDSHLSITNVSLLEQSVTLTFNPAGGNTPSVVDVDLAGNGTFRASVSSIFGLASGVFHDGWIQVEGESGLSGFVAYADTVAKGMAITPSQVVPASDIVFAHIADLDPWWTGLALLNSTGTLATVEVFAMTPAGELIGGADNVPTARFTLAPRTKTAKLLSEIVPQTGNRTSDGGFVYVRSTVPLHGIQLFFTRDLQILANVSGRALLPGTYTPPAP